MHKGQQIVTIISFLIQYYLKIYEDIHKLRDYCREEYFEKLEEKVGKQRRNMKKKNVIFIDPSGVCVHFSLCVSLFLHFPVDVKFMKPTPCMKPSK